MWKRGNSWSGPVLIGRQLHHNPIHNDQKTQASTVRFWSHPPPPTLAGRGGWSRDGYLHRVTAAIARRETPGPIPNPEAKPLSAACHAWESTEESKTQPKSQ